MIHSRKIRLRAIEREDLPRFVEWLSEHEASQGLCFYLRLSLAEEECWFESVQKRDAAERPLAYDIQKGERLIHVGSYSLSSLNT